MVPLTRLGGYLFGEGLQGISGESGAGIVDAQRVRDLLAVVFCQPRVGQVEAGRGIYFELAQLYVLTDDRQGALAMLDRAVGRHEWIVVTLKADPYFASLRTDPRYLDLMHRIGIP